MSIPVSPESLTGRKSGECDCRNECVNILALLIDFKPPTESDCWSAIALHELTLRPRADPVDYLLLRSMTDKEAELSHKKSVVQCRP